MGTKPYKPSRSKMNENSLYSTSYSVAHIDLKALEHNYTSLCASLPKNSHGMAILKNDAYGHGLLPTAKTLQNVNVASFGVGTLSEGKVLRAQGFNEDILILLGVNSIEEMQTCAELSLIPAIYNEQGLQWAAAQKQKKFKIAIKFETGMSRFGFVAKDMAHVLEFLHNSTQLDVVLAFSHLATADMPENEAMVHAQAKQFQTLCETLQPLYPSMQRSLCNSAASLAYSSLSASIGANIYRFGIALYGTNPFLMSKWEEKGLGLRESMRVSSRVLHVFNIKSGEHVGYGATFTATRDMRLAVIGIGYADGFTRSLSGKDFSIHINGQAAPLCGRVCMGVVMVDISLIQHVEVGQEVWIANANLENCFSVQTLAQKWGTITHECYCILGKNTRSYTHT